MDEAENAAAQRFQAAIEAALDQLHTDMEEVLGRKEHTLDWAIIADRYANGSYTGSVAFGREGMSPHAHIGLATMLLENATSGVHIAH